MTQPYYQDESVTIYNADCREVLPTLDTVDLVLTDPPYDTQTHNGALLENRIDFSPIGNVEEIVQAFLLICNKWCVVFCSLELLGQYRQASAENWVRSGVWDRVANMPQMSGDRPAQGAEGIAIFHPPGKKQWNGGGSAAIYRYLVERGHKQHPTQKPVMLFRKLVSLFSNAEDAILDPFMGSGTTLRAAKDLNRKAIGIEIEERYCEIAAQRMSQLVMPLQIGATR